MLVGDVDAVAMDGPNADAAVAASAGALRLLDTPLSIERYALALPKRHESLRRALDRALAALTADGSMDALNTRWGLAPR
ncbi:MAG: hypothetical protein DRQ55_06715 [Planctomycetota bacterium]|nr:MAG: hypothetical protein DRQ55_06715 [Planctomycetota bacterium]